MTEKRLYELLLKAVAQLEDLCECCIIGSDFEDEIGITREEYEMLKSMRF